MFGKIGKWIGIFFAVVVVGGLLYFSFVKPKQYNYNTVKAASEAGTSTTKIAKKTARVEIRKTASALAASENSPTATVPEKPVIRIVKPDQEIERIGIKIAKGIPARPECYRVVINVPEKRIRNINCQNGFIIFNSEEAMSGVEVMLAVNKYDGVDYYSLADEKGSVRFNYAVIEGDLGGQQIRPTVKMFALGIIIDKDNGKEYVILECPDAMSAKLSDGTRTVCLSPVIAGIGSQELAKKVLEQECYLDKASLQLLVPQIEVSQK